MSGNTAFVLFAQGAFYHFYTMPITLKEAVDILERNDWCSITFITANVSKGTGGKVVILPKCKIARGVANSTSKASSVLQSSDTIKKNPNHNLHFTRNVQLYGSKEIITIHPLLITQINKHTVI